MKAQTLPPKPGTLTAREVRRSEHERTDALLNEKHPQRIPKRVGHELRMVVEQDADTAARLTLFAALPTLQPCLTKRL